MRRFPGTVSATSVGMFGDGGGFGIGAPTAIGLGLGRGRASAHGPRALDGRIELRDVLLDLAHGRTTTSPMVRPPLASRRISAASSSRRPSWTKSVVPEATANYWQRCGRSRCGGGRAEARIIGPPARSLRSGGHTAPERCERSLDMRRRQELGLVAGYLRELRQQGLALPRVASGETPVTEPRHRYAGIACKAIACSTRRRSSAANRDMNGHTSRNSRSACRSVGSVSVSLVRRA